MYYLNTSFKRLQLQVIATFCNCTRPIDKHYENRTGYLHLRGRRECARGCYFTLGLQSMLVPFSLSYHRLQACFCHQYRHYTTPLPSLTHNRRMSCLFYFALLYSYLSLCQCFLTSTTVGVSDNVFRRHLCS